MSFIRIPPRRVIPDSDEEEYSQTPDGTTPDLEEPAPIRRHATTTLFIPEKRKRGRPKSRHSVRMSSMYDLDGSSQAASPAADASRADTPIEFDNDEYGEMLPGSKTRTVKGRSFAVEDDEVILDDDPDGDKKIDVNGNPLGGREFLFQTFTLPMRPNPNKRYMLAIDAAHAAGMRDSLDFFRKNNILIKTNCTRQEKDMFIQQGRVHPNMKNKNVALTACRNAFKVMGAKFIKNGKHVIDDYYEQAAIKSGAIAGTSALVQPYQRNAENDTQTVPKLGPIVNTSSMAFIPKALQDTFVEKEQKTQFGPASVVPFARWDPSAKQRKPGPFTPLDWPVYYARAIAQNSREIRRWRDDQFRAVPLNYVPHIPDTVLSQETFMKSENDQPSDSMEIDQQVPSSVPPLEKDQHSMPSNSDAPLCKFDTQTNLPHVRLVTQPTSATYMPMRTLPLLSTSDSEWQTQRYKNIAQELGLCSIEFFSEIKTDMDSELENRMESEHWRHVPGLAEFLSISV